MTKSAFYRLLLAAMASLPFTGGDLAAQRDASAGVIGRPCGVEDSLQAKRVFSILASAKPSVREALQAAGFSPQSPAATHGVLRRANVCAVLRSMLPSHVNAVDVPSEGFQKADWRFFILGDYLGVQVVSRVPTQGVQRRGQSGVYIFRRPTAADDGAAIRSRMRNVGRLSA